ncbi:MAG: hypothetical protein ACK559_39710, partial [bacterium]
MKGSGTPGRRWEKTPAQIAISGSEESAKPTSDGEARGQPDAELAMMMAVMILGMSPAHGYSIGADPGSLEVGGQIEM